LLVWYENWGGSNMQDSQTNLQLKQRLLKGWEEHHEEFRLLSEVYDQKWQEMKEAKLKTGHYLFRIMFNECPNMKFLMMDSYGDARRYLCNLSEKELLEIVEAFDDYVEFFLRKIYTTISDYDDRLTLGKNRCYVMGAEKCYYLRQDKRKRNK